MKAVILAAGKGTRLQPITDSLPKVMVEIGGKPLLQHHIEWLAKNEIREIGINLHYLPSIIKDYFKDGNTFKVNLQYSFEHHILGTSGGYKKFENFIGNDQCIIIYGDNIFELDFRELINFHQKKGGIATICVKEWEDATAKGITEIDEDDKILSFIEKPQSTELKSKIGNAGIYLMQPDVFKYIKDDTFSDFGHDIFPNMLSKREEIYAFKLKGYHEDIGTIDALQRARQSVSQFQN